MRNASFFLTSLALSVACAGTAASPKEYHVSIQGNDANDGSASHMFRTISAAALVAQPGDTITVHAGVYHERVNPPRGGESDTKRITYQAAPGEKAEITGSEIVKDWVKVQDDTWKAVLPNSLFGSFNPYSDLIHGDWFDPRGREHHTGAVYLDGEWLMEAATLDEVQKPVGETPLWFGQVDAEHTTLWAQFKGVNPNEQVVEINVRQTVFYPDQPFLNYITVRGFTLRQAATPWAPPTAEQVGLIGTHWSKGWIIENNIVSHSTCSGIALGKYGDEFDNTSANTAEGYVATIDRALKNGWNKETIGHHVVRNNTISHCEQTGIVGSMGAGFSTVTGNTIHDIHVRRLFSGAEMAGIKFHAAIDTEIRGNHIFRTCLGLWLDWMAQGARVSGNLFHDNLDRDLFVEVDHGPLLVDNNIFLTPRTLLSLSQGVAYVHNLVPGEMILNPYDARLTPFHKPHSTELAGMHDNPYGDDRYYNNVFAGHADLRPYDTAPLPVWMDGNVFLDGAQPSKVEKNPLLQPEVAPAFSLIEKADGIYLEGNFDTAWATERARKLVTSELLGKAAIPNAAYENRDGSPLRVQTDYLGAKRNEANPFPGPLEISKGGKQMLKVWPVSGPK
ncbi:MAG: right-handed parallel beta-helix repeat-containing protein [Candidatus Hydrogenedentes bacterium]|nr:right-handed parallel beta-helix repeat-containing protein [Candidatus Hydrogenedentota bacterium]